MLFTLQFTEEEFAALTHKREAMGVTDAGEVIKAALAAFNPEPKAAEPPHDEQH